MKQSSITDKILLAAITLVSVCIAGVLALAASVLLPEFLLQDSEALIASTEDRNTTEVANVEIERDQRLQVLESLYARSNEVEATSTQKTQQTILQALSQ